MAEHFNVQIHLQRVREKEEARDSKGYVQLTAGAKPVILERKVTEVFNLSITAETERDAYERAMRVIRTQIPDVVVAAADRWHPRPSKDDTQA